MSRKRRQLIVDVTLVLPLLRDLLTSGLWGQSLEEVVDRLIGAAIIDMKARGILFPSELARQAAAKKRQRHKLKGD